jgi:hypothetical protein
LFLRRSTIKAVAPAFVIPSAGADVCLSGHSSKGFEGRVLRTLMCGEVVVTVASAVLSGKEARKSKCAEDSAHYSI